MLLVGNAGMGKSCISKEFLRTWAEGKNDHYKCIIYLTFQELNSIEQDISIKELLERECESLSSVLTLKNPDDLLIILDGLDEFKYDLNFDNQPLRNDVDTSFPISALVSKLISKDLLPDVDIMVTARWNVVSNLEKYFTCMFVIQGFDDQQIKQYFSHLCENKNESESICDFIKKKNMSDFASVPLYSFMLPQIIKNYLDTSEISLRNLNTNSRFLIQFVKSCLENVLKHRKSLYENSTVVEMTEPAIQKNMEDLVIQLGELSYEILLSGEKTVNAKDLEKHSLSEKILTEYFPYFFCMKHVNESSFEYRHTTVKEILAAFYCACVVRDDELKECLNAWVRGVIPPSAKSKLLSDVTSHHKLQLENFTRLFMSFLSTGNNIQLLGDTAMQKNTTREVLIEWFQDWLQEDLCPDDCLNLLYYIFELQDPVVTQRVSAYMKNIKLFNKPLSAIDVQALRFSLKESKLEELDLRLCELGDKGVEQLKKIITNCKTVLVSSNKLSEKSGETFNEILKDPDCAIEELSFGTNDLGPVGVRSLWKALESNRTLKTLRVYDNDINDEGTETLVQSLTKNTTLKKLFLCVNNFTECGLENIKELRKSRPDLMVVQKIVEDEELFRYVQKHVEKLDEDWKRYDPQWLTKLLETVQNDLSEEEVPSTNTTLKKEVKDLQTSIQNMLVKIKSHAQESKTKMRSKNRFHISFKIEKQVVERQPLV
nr:PREDICTED: protein NLRC3-like [Latimeria chalumnae]XP_014351370.1 PREDICTED: protein NLRC3-like [Latimeria chalumnae]XP_014351372.1 PREDICTED: protein NLRC3-like [Latimeria chalumnae]XP_014351373.1 PREDICTED: protein NLRC3-like [Latimeria chalumnae]|eukprot:XP_014351369.1 PREDICTED: protein NLRC3-like [Latimeria chalumnae]